MNGGSGDDTSPPFLLVVVRSKQIKFAYIPKIQHYTRTRKSSLSHLYQAPLTCEDRSVRPDEHPAWPASPERDSKCADESQLIKCPTGLFQTAKKRALDYLPLILNFFSRRSGVRGCP